MAEHIEIGKAGEKLAKDHLLMSGYRIVETNWRYGHNEIDIIAEHKNQLVIVEVKTRKSSFFGEPEMAVNKTKQQSLIRAANAFIKFRKIGLETRFDIISIIFNSKKHKIKHIEYAFYPTL